MHIHIYSQAGKSEKKFTPNKFVIFQEMEPSSSKIKKFLIFWEMELCSSKIKQVLIFWEMELSGSNIFSKESFSYILGNENPEKIPYILGSGTFLYLRKWKS